MAIFGVQNPTISERFRKLFGFKSLFSDTSVEYTPTVRVNDGAFYAKQQIVRSATSTSTIYTTENDPQKQFYIDGVMMSGAHLTASAVTNIITATIDNTAQVIGTLHLASTVAEGMTAPAVALNFPIPLRIDRNTNITFTLGSSAGTAIIYGHYEKQL